MRADRIVARGFRNLADLDLALPPGGAVFLGPNGHGKTNLLELLYYPVLFRSLRGARDIDVTRHGEAGFHLTLTLEDGRTPRELSAGFRCAGKRKRLLLDGVEPDRLGDALGHWLAVAFLPTDLRLVQGAAAERRQYLDRVLSLADREYLRALSRYRAALAQRNAALRQHRPDLAGAFDIAIASAGSLLVARRLAWSAAYQEPLTVTCIALGETAEVTLRYRGDDTLADPARWPDLFARAASRDAAHGVTTVGPHRHDLDLRIDGRSLREVGSTGQQRTAALALKLLERETLAAASGAEPVLLLDDVFAELDRRRQHRLAARLLAGGARQTFITSPREDELPDGFHLEMLAVDTGRVSQGLMA
ncbi:MAG TPA: DNA replication and repair protein RecF [Gemmatimonadales bacterium]|jgi:DNA replication and repair protein RecF|nr:DNA replication and repair protein RecF [Gemmatimonadales bacterium]